MSFFLSSVSFSMSPSSTLALNFISLTLAIKLSMAFVTASALSVALFKFIAHHYFEVDADQIWWIIENELQPLKMAICEMIESLKANA